MPSSPSVICQCFQIPLLKQAVGLIFLFFFSFWFLNRFISLVTLVAVAYERSLYCPVWGKLKLVKK